MPIFGNFGESRRFTCFWWGRAFGREFGYPLALQSARLPFLASIIKALQAPSTGLAVCEGFRLSVGLAVHEGFPSLLARPRTTAR